MARYISIALLILWAGSLHAQEGYELQLHTAEGKLPSGIKVESNFSSPAKRKAYLEDLLSTLQQEGYLTASIDSTKEVKNLMHAHFHVGEALKWAQLGKGNVEEEVLSQIGFREKLYQGRPLNPRGFQRLQARLLQFYENHGYPFAAIRLDSIQIANQQLNGTLHVEKNLFVKIDTIIIKGDARIAPIYIHNYIGIKPGDVYNESIVRRISTRIKEIPFLQEIKGSQVVFTPDKASLYLYLKGSKASQFNGIIGILPDNQTGEITVTGDIKLKLKNALKRGELIDFNWRKLQPLTQNLDVKLNYPFLLNTPLGVDLNFSLYKRDTTYLEVIRNLGLQYLLRGEDYVKVYFNRSTSDLLSLTNILNQTTLPEFADVATTTYGLGFNRVKLDYRPNPQRGYRFFVDGGVGTKVITKNDSLEEVNPNIYDGVNLRSTQFNIRIDGEAFVPIGKRSTVRFGAKGGHLINDNLFINEMYRLGGIKTLRGFDEETIFASTYGIGTIEFRYLFERNSNFFVFYDGAYYEQIQTEEKVIDTPYGFGAGVNFETKAGIFSINYALGKQFDNPIRVSAAKIHFGFVNFF